MKFMQFKQLKPQTFAVLSNSVQVAEITVDLDGRHPVISTTALCLEELAAVVDFIEGRDSNKDSHGPTLITFTPNSSLAS